MFILKHDNVDGYNSTWDKYPNKPTEEDLKKSLSAYFYEGEKLDRICKELVEFGECDVDDGDGTTFEIEEI